MKTDQVNIFIVEDDDIDTMAIRRSLKNVNIIGSIYVAKDGIEALEKLRAGNIPPPYIILMDLNMPRMNGIDCIKEIRLDPHLKQAIIFALSTSKDEKDKFQVYNYNVAGYIIKCDAGDDFDMAMRMLEQYLKVVELPNK